MILDRRLTGKSRIVFGAAKTSLWHLK